MKNHLSEISSQEKNRILEMHKKSTQRHYLVEDKETPPQPTPTPNTPSISPPHGGPLVGTILARNPEGSVEFGQTIEFKFPKIKNSGGAPITIIKIMPHNDNMKVDKPVPFTVKPGETFELTAKHFLQKGGTSTQKMDMNGVVDFDQHITIFTDGKKPNYLLYCRQKLVFDRSIEDVQD